MKGGSAGTSLFVKMEQSFSESLMRQDSSQGFKAILVFFDFFFFFFFTFAFTVSSSENSFLSQSLNLLQILFSLPFS